MTNISYTAEVQQMPLEQGRYNATHLRDNRLLLLLKDGQALDHVLVHLWLQVSEAQLLQLLLEAVQAKHARQGCKHLETVL